MPRSYERGRRVAAPLSDLVVAGTPEAVGPVPVPERSVERDVRPGAEPAEASGPSRKGDLTGEGGEREVDVPENFVSGTGVENEVAVQPAGAGRLEVEDLRTGRDRTEVRGGDRAELTRLAVVVAALLRHMERPVSRRVMCVARLAGDCERPGDGDGQGQT